MVEEKKQELEKWVKERVEGVTIRVHGYGAPFPVIQWVYESYCRKIAEDAENHWKHR